MINPARRYRRNSSLHKFELTADKKGQSLPPGALLLESLKTLESQLQARKMLLPDDSTPYNPLWFLAETERNIFLWRAGYSLIQADEFEFWVDVPRLIEKRLSKLAGGDPQNPFLNAAWGYCDQDTPMGFVEEEYLHTLRDLFLAIQNHASALSQVASMLLKEYGCCEERPIVLLPVERQV
ncbi:MAG: hypothetical protein J5J00_06470 [Deltaproteobacteria bacterium]|nr:hypothetical protein [Deltaproteobacteria bacterium]